MGAYVYVWEFQVRPERVDEFRAQYGPGGAWDRLFRQAPGYIETLLLQDRAQALRFLTVDRWQAAADWQAFETGFAAQYRELDRRCDGLTTAETLIGHFDMA